MSELRVKLLNSLDELRASSSSWDDLWQRSEVTLPTARAEMLAIWAELFAAARPLRALVVEDSQSRALAALPLHEDFWRGHRVARLGGNEWSPAGELLLDPQGDVDRVCDTLVGALREQSWPLVSFSAIARQSRHWQTFFQSVDRARLNWASRPRCAVNLVRIGSDFEAYFAGRSANHRRSVRRALSRAKKDGFAQLERHLCATADEVEPLLRVCFELEASGWKGRAASAILHHPQAVEFYLHQAQQLARWGQLSVTLLKYDGRPIAFEYGWITRRVYASLKVGYDEAFGHLTPGQLLRYLSIEEMFRSGDVAWFDFLGPVAPATTRWATDRYQVDTVDVALQGFRSRGRVALYQQLGPLVRAMRGTQICDALPITCSGPECDGSAADTQTLAAPTAAR